MSISKREAVQRLAARIYKQGLKFGKLPSTRDVERKAQKIAEQADKRKERR